ncbi:TetR/AcrR family transcriptional regulator [Smaragdicoccus niigatensis]|uniref:TetR/AcrR family transcriptional regulator n=1 Tax=Smaragdicoccus niigatensis TaxID=359359 RepID=UPI0003626DF1|nr:TetR/AcrR family transcriptional regulator [Smaragdicoccus niigatensis]
MAAQNPSPAGRRIRGLDADERRKQRRNDLLDAALDLFARQGYLNTSIEQICQAAYVGTKSFYEVFENREAVYVALLQRSGVHIAAIMASALENAPTDQVSGVLALTETFAHAFVDDVRLAKVAFGEGSAATPGAERQRRLNRRWTAVFIESIWRRYGVVSTTSVPGVANGVAGGMVDIVADWTLDADPSDETAVVSLVRDLHNFFMAVTYGLLSVEMRVSEPL